MKKMQSQDPNKTFILYDRDAFNEAMMSMNEDEIELDVSAVIDGEWSMNKLYVFSRVLIKNIFEYFVL